MKKLTLQDTDTKSLDIIADNIAQLQALFPDAFTEGQIDFAVLKQLLGGTIDDREEKYSLNWHGKRRARQLALMPSTGTLRPCPEDSVDWDATQNLMIEGDNLEVLKLLQKSYSGKVKLIYIDPPYNTGGDFVYPDDYRDNIQNYLELTGQIDATGRRLTSNTEASGRFHTDWLNMMYPRLFLARQLLREDGVMLVSIDDGEVANLKLAMNEIFGEENFLAHIVWQKRYVSNVTAQYLSDMHDHILVYARQKEAVRVNRLPRTEEQLGDYKNPDNDPRGPWRAQDLSASKPYSAGLFTITTPAGIQVDPPPGRYWRCNQAQYEEWVTNNRIWFGVNGTARPMLKAFLSEVQEGLTPNTWWSYDFAGHNKEATLEIKALFDGSSPFDTAKPIKLLRRILELFTELDSLVLDFFAGSGTTGQAVMAQNAEEDGNRRYILVQLPEPLDPDDKDQKAASDFCDKLGKPSNIAEVTMERLRRAGQKVRAESPMFAGDTGFRVFKLDSSNIQAWDPDRDNLPHSLLSSVDHLKSERTEQDILFELLLKLGLDLTVPIEHRTIAGKTVHSIGSGALLACLVDHIGREEVEPLALGIAAWHKEQSPVRESSVVFRDSAFTDDVAKTNLASILQQHGLDNVRSL